MARNTGPRKIQRYTAEFEVKAIKQPAGRCGSTVDAFDLPGCILTLIPQPPTPVRGKSQPAEPGRDRGSTTLLEPRPASGRRLKTGPCRSRQAIIPPVYVATDDLRCTLGLQT